MYWTLVCALSNILVNVAICSSGVPSTTEIGSPPSIGWGLYGYSMSEEPQLRHVEGGVPLKGTQAALVLEQLEHFHW